MSKFSGYGYEMEELREKFEGQGIKIDAEFKMGNRKISGLASPTDIYDAVTLGYANNNYVNKSTDNNISGNNTFTGINTFTNTISGDISGNSGTVTNGVYTIGDQTISGIKTFSNTISGDISGNSGTVTNGVYTIGDQTIGGTKTFSKTIIGDISGNAGTVTDGVYTTGNQTIGGIKTFSKTIIGDISGNAGTVTNGVYTTGNQTIAGIKTFSDSIAVDTISEGAGVDGVVIDGVKLKDGGITFTGDSVIFITEAGDQNADGSFSFRRESDKLRFRGRYAGALQYPLDLYSNGNSVFNGNVGIGITPTEKLHVSEGNLLNSGTFGTSPALSISGAGSRMFFYPKKSAFRAGYVDGAQWDDANIGNHSTAMGYNTMATGNVSTAMGYLSTASGICSTAMGYLSTASGVYSTAMGHSCSATGHISTAMGYLSTASGICSTAMGRSAGAIGDYSFAINLSSTVGPDVPANTFRISGATAIGGNVAWTNYSDRREKEDIRLLSSELDKINLLKPSRFKWKEVNKGVKKTDNLGLIAQEVREIYPEVVKGNEETEILTLEYTGLIAPMIKAIQELTVKNQELLNRIEALENR